MASHAAASPFEEMAAGYDAAFTDTAIGTLLRRRVWRRLDRAFAPGERVLELGCGTGEDAVHLASRGVRVLATDSARAMVQATRKKVLKAGVRSLVDVRQVPIEELSRVGGTFDGALSNFGAMNCVDDLPGVAHRLARRLRPGARAVLCFMGPVCPWEWLWFLLRGEPDKAFRRLSARVTWRSMEIRYPTIGTVRDAFADGFRTRSLRALGVFVPPSYAGEWAGRHPRLLRLLDDAEGLVEAWPPLPWLADHFLIELERR